MAFTDKRHGLTPNPIYGKARNRGNVLKERRSKAKNVSESASASAPQPHIYRFPRPYFGLMCISLIMC